MNTVPTVDQRLDDIKYDGFKGYTPTDFAFEFINFIKLVNGSEGEENLSPVIHYKMLDLIQGKHKRIANLLFRGSGKTTIMSEYLFPYIAIYGKIPGFGKINLAIYVTDSIENGVKNLRRNMEYRWDQSSFLQHYIPKIKFTDTRWEFINKEGNIFIVNGYGAQTGVRGKKELKMRPQLAVLDDLISDSDANSASVISSIENTVHNAVNFALHPDRSKIIWSGTPFNMRDPLYKALESGAWQANVYPVCEEFPCKEEDFRGAWEDRFTYEYVKDQYDTAVKMGRISGFNQELLLRIMSDEDRLILDSDIQWYKIDQVRKNKGMFNFYITTDLATSEKKSADYSVISVWAYNNAGHWLWVDGVVARQSMDKNVDDLFRFATEYKPQQVGIEISGQQGGFIPWLQNEMLLRNIYFSFASDSNTGKPGIRPNTSKLVRFNIVVPWFKLNRIFFPLEKRDSPQLQEAISELSLASSSGFRSKHDDFCFSEDTKIQLRYNKWKYIKNIKKGDEVLTFGGDTLTMLSSSSMMTGKQLVTDYHLSDGSIVTMTDGHPILSIDGWILAKNITSTTQLVKVDVCRLNSLVTNGPRIQSQGITNPQEILMANVDGYINGFGKKSMVNSIGGMMYITKITIKKTILLPIWNYYQEASTINITALVETLNKHVCIWQPYAHLQKYGIVHHKEGIGIYETMKTIRVAYIRSMIENANTVKRICNPTSRIGKFTVALLVPIKKYKQMMPDIKILCVKIVNNLLDGIGLKSRVAHPAPTLLVVKKENTRKVDTYNFEVDGTHNYILYNGLVAHNCDTISMLASLTPWKPSEVSPHPSDSKSNLWDDDPAEQATILEGYIV